MTKKQMVKEHLLSGKPLTSWDAIQLYRVTRLSGVIFDLKKEGLDIKDVSNGVNYAIYKYYPPLGELF
jgi:hypothetical protein